MHRETLEKFAESRDLDLDVIIDTENPEGRWYFVNYDLHYRHPVTPSLYREIIQTLETNGAEAFDNIDLEAWELF